MDMIVDDAALLRRDPDPERLNALVGRMLGELGAAFILPLVRLGDELGLYRVMDEAGEWLSAEDLSRRTGLSGRMLREWLSAHTAAGYLDFDAETGRFTLNPEQAMILARPDSPAFMLGAFEMAVANVVDGPKVAEAFRTGRGFGYQGRCPCLFSGIERFFRPGYQANLVDSWLPALDGVVERLEAGTTVADVGCGHGASSILLARAFPKSSISGFDYHAASIACARDAAARAGVSGNARFEVAGAADFPGQAYGLIACFDALHDMGDPVGVARHVRDALAPDGTFMVVEPLARNRPEENHNPVGRLYYAASTMICTPVALSQAPDGPALGAQAGPERLAEVLRAAGFGRVRVATETAFNLVLEARP